LQPEATNGDGYYHSSSLGEDRVGLGMQPALYLDPHRSAPLPASIQVRARAVHVSSLDDSYDTIFVVLFSINTVWEQESFSKIDGRRQHPRLSNSLSLVFFSSHPAVQW